MRGNVLAQGYTALAARELRPTSQAASSHSSVLYKGVQKGLYVCFQNEQVQLLRAADCDAHPLPPATAAFFFSLIEIYIFDLQCIHFRCTPRVSILYIMYHETITVNLVIIC